MNIKLSDAHKVHLKNKTAVSVARPVLKLIYERLRLDPGNPNALHIANTRMTFLMIVANQQGLDLLKKREFNICNTILERSRILN